MHVTWPLVGVVIAVLLPGNAIAGALEDCAAAFDRQDYAAALRLCRPLAEQDDVRSQTSLGGMYSTAKVSSGTIPGRRNGCARRPNGATLRRRPTLGIMYWNGQGVPRDAVLAYMWLSLAAEQEPDAVKERDLAASEMTPDEIDKAQRLAREWKPKQATTPSP